MKYLVTIEVSPDLGKPFSTAVVGRDGVPHVVSRDQLLSYAVELPHVLEHVRTKVLGDLATLQAPPTLPV